MVNLFGRQRELSEVAGWLGRDASLVRLVTITGPPGVGKSRFALEVSRQHPGSAFCDLTTCRVAADVERSLRGALGGVSRSRLSAALARFQGVIVLDRFEHLVAGAADLVAGWTAGPGAHFIVTSREPLGLPLETVLVLEPLEDDDAVALYCARAQRQVDRDVARSIVRKLDRLPLAIELTAARASLLSDGELLARLQFGMTEIDSAAKLRATILWSLALLSVAERSALLQCAVFRGAFDGRAAEAVVELDGSDTVTHLVLLERKNLVRRAGSLKDARIALYDAVREVALDELTRSGQVETVRTRHARYFLALGNEALATRDAAATLALARDSDDLDAARLFFRDRDARAATELALALDLAQGAQTPSHAHLDLLGAALESAERANDACLKAKVLHARARTHRLLGAAQPATSDLRVALALARAAGASDVEADVLRMLGVVGRQRSQPARARVLLRRALELYEGAGDLRGVAMVCDDLGVVAHDRGDLTAARESFERALAHERLVGDRRFEGITLGHLGFVAHDLGDVEQAQTFYGQALACHRETGDTRFETFAYAFLAALDLERLNFEGAGRSIEAAAAIDARIGEVDSGVLLGGLTCALSAATGQIIVAREVLVRAQLALAGRDLERMLKVFAAAVDVAEARRAQTEQRADDERMHLARARQALLPEPRSIEEAIARRVVAKLIERDFGARAAAVVASDGTWFETSAGRVSLATRRSLVGMLGCLAAGRQSSPGQSVTLMSLFEAGWPGESINEASARRRVYVGIDALRTLGLRAALVQKERGYLLDASVEVRDAL